MRNLTRFGLAASGALLALLLAASCTPRIGWGLLLWTDQEAGLHAGAVVPVYIRSNIEKKYVIGVPESNRKVEVPLWQLELFGSKRAAEKARLPFGSYLTSYLFANRDGLPVRETPTNLGRRVYRLREGQSVKILSEVQGDVVKTGTDILQGSWFKVLTEDGSQGYVFSNTMRMYDELTEAPPSIAQSASDNTARSVDLVFSRTWRGEYFQTMIDDGRIDLDTFNARYGLFSDAVRRQIRIEQPLISQVFNYTSIAQSGQDFLFEGTPLRIRFDGDNRLIADWSGATTDVPSTGTSAQSIAPLSTSGQLPGQSAPPALTGHSTQDQSQPAQAPSLAGSSTTPSSPSTIAAPVPSAASTPTQGGANATQAVFVVLSQDIREIIRAEETRRLNLLGHFIDAGSVWALHPESAMAAVSAPAAPGSTLSLFRAGRFVWTSINSVPAEYLGTDLGTVSDGAASGEATVRLYLDPSLSGAWEGALSLRFDGTRDWIDFLYRHEGNRLLLQPIALGGVKDLVVSTAANLAPLSFDGSK